jgi:hypothetical protein
LVPVMIFCETWDAITTFPVTFNNNAIITAQSDEGWTGLTGFTATPFANLRVNTVSGSQRLQRSSFGAGGVFGVTSVALGNSLRAPMTPLDEDTVTSISMSARFFIGALTPDGTTNFPASGLEAYRDLTTFNFTIGDGTGGDVVLGSLPGVYGANRAALNFSVNNARTAGGGFFPRLLVAINDPAFGQVDAFIGGAVPNSDTGVPTVGITPIGAGQALQGIAGATAHTYDVGVTFTKNNFSNTLVQWAFTPVAGTAPTPVSGSGSLTLAASFPFNRTINQAALNVGSGFGLSLGPAAGSWIDDLKVWVFGAEPGDQPSAVTDWEVFE